MENVMIPTGNKHTKGGAALEGSSSNSDPTYNVLQLVNAAVERLNDINKIERDSNREVIALNKEILNLHIAYQDKLSIAESRRIDAIRAVDVGAVAIASERATQQATVLANQVSASADALRNLVTTTATAAAAQQQSVSTQLMDRITLLERSQYESKGLSGIPPQVLERLTTLEQTRFENKGKSMGYAQIVGLVLAGAAVVGAILKLL